jgi:hypothetical protein
MSKPEVVNSTIEKKKSVSEQIADLYVATMNAVALHNGEVEQKAEKAMRRFAASRSVTVHGAVIDRGIGTAKPMFFEDGDETVNDDGVDVLRFLNTPIDWSLWESYKWPEKGYGVSTMVMQPGPEKPHQEYRHMRSYASDQMPPTGQIGPPHEGERLITCHEAIPEGFEIVDSGYSGFVEAVIVAPKHVPKPPVPERVFLKRCAKLAREITEISPHIKPALMGWNTVK